MYKSIFTNKEETKPQPTGYKSIFGTQSTSTITKEPGVAILRTGGALNVGAKGTQDLIKTGHTTYGGVPTKKGYERADIIPVSLGGSNQSAENITYEKILPFEKLKYQLANIQKKNYVPKTATDKYLMNEILPAYKSGKITLNEARVKVVGFLQAQQMGLKQGVLGNLAGAVKDMFVGTVGAVKDIVSNPLNKTSNFKKTLVENTVKQVKDTVVEEKNRIVDLFKTPAPGKLNSTSQFASKLLKVGTGGANVLFSPLTTLFGAAESIPVVGTLVKIALLPLSVGSDVGRIAFEKGLDVLPIDKKVKANLKEAVGEIGSLAGMILIGGKFTEKSIEVLKREKSRLVEKYGENDANTIIEKAREKARITEAEQVKTENFKELHDIVKGKVETPKVEVKTEPLIEEARKYKTAEEFANTASNNIVDKLREQGVRGAEQRKEWFNKNVKLEEEVLDSLNPTGGLFVDYTPQKRATMKLGSNITTLDKTLNKNPDEIITIYRGAPANQTKIVPGDFVSTNYDIAKSYTDKNVLSKKVKLKDLLDDLDEPSLGEETIYRPKSQLIDIWNKAQTEIQDVKMDFPKPPSGVAQSIEAKAVERGMVEKGYADLAGYDASTIKAQSKLASEYTIEQIKRIATGEEALPERMKPGTPLSIAEDYGLANNDVQLLLDLAKSPLATQISEAGSELSLSRMRDKESAVAKIKEVSEARKSKFKEEVKSEAKSIKDEIKKTKPTKDAWLSFVDEIKC